MMKQIQKSLLSAEEFKIALQGRDERFITKVPLFKHHGTEITAIAIQNIRVTEDVFLTTDSEYAIYPVVIQNTTFDGHFSINKGIFSSPIDIDAICKKGLTIRGGEFNSLFTITGGQYDILDLTGGSFKNSLGIVGCIFNDCTIGGVETELWLSIHRSTFNKLTLTGRPKMERGIHIDQCNIGELNFSIESSNLVRIRGKNDMTINQINLSGLVFKESLFSFHNIKVNSVNFFDVINNGQIYFNGVSAGQEIGLVKQEGDNEFTGTGDADFNLINSDLGKTTFINCDLKEFYLTFKSSKINEVFIAGTEWFQPNRINVGTTDFDYQQDKLILSQTRKMYEGMGDTGSAVEYHARELNMHLKYLKQKRGHFSEIFQLSLNKWSSNHGANYLQAFLVLLGVSLILFSLYCIALTGISVNFSFTGFKELGRRLLYFIEFINPLHKAEYLAEEITPGIAVTQNPISIFIDGLSRIIIAYLIYQFVQAFRKHGKK